MTINGYSVLGIIGLLAIVGGLVAFVVKYGKSDNPPTWFYIVMFVWTIAAVLTTLSTLGG